MKLRLSSPWQIPSVALRSPGRCQNFRSLPANARTLLLTNFLALSSTDDANRNFYATAWRFSSSWNVPGNQANSGLTSNVFVGVVVCAKDNSALNNTSVDNVTVTPAP